MWYLCGLGSNVEPRLNLANAVATLLEENNTLWLSPVIHTQPKGIVTKRSFLNALVVFYSPLSLCQLKNRTNALEEALGRDRADPLRSLKDRRIDVDILEQSGDGCFTGATIEESYYRELFTGLEHTRSARVTIRIVGHSLGQAPATIHRDARSGDVVVIQEGQHLHHHAVKASFSA